MNCALSGIKNDPYFCAASASFTQPSKLLLVGVDPSRPRDPEHRLQTIYRHAFMAFCALISASGSFMMANSFAAAGFFSPPMPYWRPICMVLTGNP
ncbi:Uncharacterised protein [Salmonella enterica subsp. enterica]|uniref:Uncharacterized protein n=1 Tax=Salmonella enterica I TaxID=59201 RepID=A0A379WMZ7_SALET|nr:Uncharacterised protein [Salmonella enterica subsp. enterica]